MGTFFFQHPYKQHTTGKTMSETNHVGMVSIPPIKMVIWGTVYGIVLPTLYSDNLVWLVIVMNQFLGCTPSPLPIETLDRWIVARTLLLGAMGIASAEQSVLVTSPWFDDISILLGKPRILLVSRHIFLSVSDNFWIIMTAECWLAGKTNHSFICLELYSSYIPHINAPEDICWPLLL